MRQSDWISAGGRDSRFPETDWSEIRRAKTQNEAHQREIIGHFAERYWKPVYCYLIYKGRDRDAAEDLVQGFFREVVLGRGLIQRADPAKGRFRSFLLTALSRYLEDERRVRRAKKRTPPEGVVLIGADELANLPAVLPELCPEQAFHYAWATSLLDEVLAEIRNEYCSGSREDHWRVFHDVVLAPILDDTKVPPLVDICVKYGIKDESAASNMLTVVKRRFRGMLMRRLRAFVRSDEELQQEYDELFEVLSKGGAR